MLLRFHHCFNGTTGYFGSVSTTRYTFFANFTGMGGVMDPPLPLATALGFQVCASVFPAGSGNWTEPVQVGYTVSMSNLSLPCPPGTYNPSENMNTAAACLLCPSALTAGSTQCAPPNNPVALLGAVTASSYATFSMCVCVCVRVRVCVRACAYVWACVFSCALGWSFSSVAVRFVRAVIQCQVEIWYWIPVPCVFTFAVVVLCMCVHVCVCVIQWVLRS
jgi:hypothetical protein